MASSTEEEWPDMISESATLLFDSIFMYALPDLHALGRKGLLKEGDVDLLGLPISNETLLAVIMKNREALENAFSPSDLKLYGTALFLVKKTMEHLGSVATQGCLERQIVAFDDEDSNSELVYGIVKSDTSKQITVCFRGSATFEDLLVDADGLILEFDNPINPNSREKIGVHQGFHDYLNGTPEGEKNGMSKYSEIMSQLNVMFQENPDYRLYVSGHSLGASLAQLFAMQAAASQELFAIPKPVTSINFASPKVGNIYYRNCVETLEDVGLLRILRFTNDLDIVPTLPDRQNCSCLRNLRCQPSVYRHAGPRIILYGGGTYEIRYELHDEETVWKFATEAATTHNHGIGFALMVPTLLRYSKTFLTNHSCELYMQRFVEMAQRHGGAANKIYLNDVYDNSAKLEKLLEEGFSK